MFQRCPICKGKSTLKKDTCPTCLGERIISKENGLPPSKQFFSFNPYVPYSPTYPIYPTYPWDNPIIYSTVIQNLPIN